MFFWNKVREKDLETMLKSVTDFSKLHISVAFCSLDGALILEEICCKSKISRNNVEIILRKDFATAHCSEILKRLSSIGQVYIKKSDEYHPKVYLFEHQNYYTLIFGSANLSKNGLKNNLEFCQRIVIDKPSIDLIGFQYASLNQVVLVTDEIINRYEANEKEILEFAESTKGLTNLFNNSLGISDDDPIDKQNYLFNNHTFIFEDYETFFPRNAISSDATVIARRKNVQSKLLDLLPFIKMHIESMNYDLHPHWDSRHITSLIDRTAFNKYYVGWLGVRLGKTDTEIEKFKYDSDYSTTNDYGFQKHSCLQYSVFPDCFWIGIFHAVRYGAIDRYYVDQEILNVNYQKKLIKEIERLKSLTTEYLWNLGENTFDIHKESPSDFINFYLKNSIEGNESLVGVRIPIDDKILSSLQIQKTICNVIDDLYPLYKLIANRYK